MPEIVFFISLSFIFSTYIGYPLALWLQQRTAKIPLRTSGCELRPLVSVVIAAKNEERALAGKLHSLLEQEYPPDRLEIIVVDDASTDSTASVVQGVANESMSRSLAPIRLIAQAKSEGKPNALNMGVGSSGGEIIVFSDARQRFDRNAIKELVANFSDPGVGCVSGELLFVDENDGDLHIEMGSYWRYEKQIRKMESDTGSVVGATGAIYAIRRELFSDIPVQTLLDDVLIPLQISMRGYRVVFESAALAYDRVSENMEKEWRRKVRTLSGNWQLLSLNIQIINPLRNRYAGRFFWHKLARLMVPFFLMMLMVSSLLAEGRVYMLFTLLQGLFYFVALFSVPFASLRNNAVIRLCYFFCLMNVAAAYSMFIWLSGRCGTIWKR